MLKSQAPNSHGTKYEKQLIFRMKNFKERGSSARIQSHT